MHQPSQQCQLIHWGNDLQMWQHFFFFLPLILPSPLHSTIIKSIYAHIYEKLHSFFLSTTAHTLWVSLSGMRFIIKLKTIDTKWLDMSITHIFNESIIIRCRHNIISWVFISNHIKLTQQETAITVAASNKHGNKATFWDH